LIFLIVNLKIVYPGRPCQRCIKRSIGQLCHDEPKGTHSVQKIQTPPVHVVQPNLLTISAVAPNGNNFVIKDYIYYIYTLLTIF
jgi:hypothetical protein